MDLFRLKALIEGIIFSSAEPVEEKELADHLCMDPATLSMLVREIEEKHSAADSGIRLIRLAGGLTFVTSPDMAGDIAGFLASVRQAPLTDASMETLAIIAYKQPITKAEIEQIRGVGAESALITLAQRGLVAEKGRKSAPGRPILYGTTKQFLAYLGVNDIGALPGLEMEEDAAEKLPGME